MSQTALSIDHPALRTALGMVVGYGIVLAIVFVVFFLVPYLLFLG
ncbi:MAG: hypothetical protein ABEJ59_01030 [Halanaeroarchaeum sp.]